MNSVTLVLVALLLSVASASYNVSKSLAWINAMGCVNATITNCPGGRLCTDTEFYARALAAGGVIDLNPNDPTQAPYESYEGFNLCLGEGFTSFLTYAGFQKTNQVQAPVGSILFTQAWYPPGMPVFALGNGTCDSHTPIIANGPHCNIKCAYFIPKVVFLPPAGMAVIH
jgi:hypothetical protein